jgi:hypothetical protein
VRELVLTISPEEAARIGDALVSDVNFLVPELDCLALVTVGGGVLVSVQGSDTLLWGVVTEIDPTVPGGPMVTMVI